MNTIVRMMVTWPAAFAGLAVLHAGTDVSNTGSPVSGQQFSYSFDPIGNRAWDSGDPGVMAYTTNNLNQYTATANPGETFTYDADGNLTQDAKFDYTWDAENRLTEVIARNPVAGSKKLVLTYDAVGRRIRKQAYTWSSGGIGGPPGWGSTPTLDRKFVYDGWNLIEELNALSGNAVVARYAWGLDLSGQAGNPATSGMRGAGGVGGILSMYDAAGAKSHLYYFNGNGDVGQLMDISNGATSARYEMYPYGGELVATGSAATVNPFRFSGKYWDTEDQTAYYGHRYLKPKMGRWLNRDPIGEMGGLNLYGMVANRPTDLVDLLGLQDTRYTLFLDKKFSTAKGAQEVCNNARETAVLIRPVCRGLQIVGAGVEVAGGAVLCATWAGAPLGGLMIASGVDDFQAAIRDGSTGKAWLGGQAAKACGGGETAQFWSGVAADFASPGLLAGALRHIRNFGSKVAERATREAAERAARESAEHAQRALPEAPRPHAGCLDELERCRTLGTGRQGYRRHEEACARQLESRVGKLTRCSDETLGDWIDAAGRHYDGIGPISHMPEYKWEKFMESLNRHLQKHCDNIVIDTRGCNADQMADIMRAVQCRPANGCKNVIIQPG